MIRNAVIYLGSSIANKAAPFILLPLLTKHLTPVEFGALSLFLVINLFFYATLGMGIHTNISKHYFTSSRGELAEIIGNIFYILVCTCIVALFLCLGLALFMDQMLSMPSKIWLIFPILSFMMMANTINLTILRSEGRAYIYAGFEICNTLLNLVSTVVFLVVFDYGWYSQVLGLIIANSLFFVVAIHRIQSRGYLKFNLRVSIIRSILSLSLPLIPHVIGGVLIAVSDRIFIERMVGIDSVAYYSIGYSFGMVVILFADAFVKAWTPWFFKVMQDPSVAVKRDVVKFTYYYLTAMFILAIIIAGGGNIILPFVVSEEYIGSTEFIIWVSIGCAVQSIYKIFFPYLVQINKTSFLALSTLFAALVNLLLNYIFIRNYGSIGAAYSTIVSYGLSSALVFFYLKNKISMPWLVWR